MESSESYPVSPPEQRCTWMSAGILTYQLCDRDFNCIDCPLDRSMRNMVKEREYGERHRIPLRVDPLRLGRYYTQEHCWISITSADTVRVGLDPNLAGKCQGLIGISLPSVEREIPARTPLVWIRFIQGMIPVRLPLSVRVVRVNKRVNEDPDLLLKDPYDEGWLFEAHIERAHLEACRLMTSWTAEKVYGRDDEVFMQAVRDAGGEIPKEIGLTAYDGGGIICNLIEEIGSGRYCTLIGEVYCKT